MARAQFQGGQRAQGFNPIQVSSANITRMREESNRVVENMTMRADAELNNRRRILQDMKANAAYYEKERERDFNIQSGNVRTQQQASRARAEQVRQQARLDAAASEQIFGSISKLSKTASQKLQKMEQERYDEKWLEGVQAYMMDPDAQGLVDYEVGSDSQKISSEGYQSRIDQLEEAGADPLLVAKSRSMDPAMAQGYAYARNNTLLRDQFPVAVEAALNDSQRKYTVGGQTFTGVEARGNRARTAAVVAATQREFFKQNGLIGAKFESIAPGLAAAQRAGQNVIAREGKIEELNTKANLEANATNTLLSGNFQGNALSTFRTWIRTTGSPTKAHSKYKELATAINPETGEFLVSDADWMSADVDGSGQPYSQRFRQKTLEIQKARAEARRGIYRDRKADKAIEFDTQQQQLLEAFGGEDADGFTTEQIEEAADKLEAAFPGLQATELRRMAKGSVDAKEREKQEEQIQDLQALGLLTPERLKKFDRKLWSKYMSSAQQQAKVSTNSGEYKEQLKAVEDAVKVGPEGGKPITATADGRMSPSVRMVNIQMQQYFMKRVQEYAISDPDNAATLALNDTLDYFNKTYKDKVGPKGYTGVFGTPEEVQNARRANSARITEIDEAMKKPNFLSPEASPFRNIFTDTEVEDMSKGYGKPGWSPDASLVYIANKQGVDPLTVLNILRSQKGMDALATSPAMEVVTNELTPAQRAALANIGTPSISTRTMGSLGWKPELVPNGYGPMVEQAATSNGLQPAQIAAMAEIESNWNPNAPSYNNSSFGLMQINRSAHPQFFASKNWRDPQESLNYGAQYFAGLVKRYNGDLKAAAMAYNGGPGNYDAYVRGDYVDPVVKREMVNHGKKYMKALYKYGGAPAGELNGRGYQRTQRTSNVPYVDQRTAVNGYGDRQCFSAVSTMLANAYGVNISYDDYNTKRSKYGDTTISSAQIGALRELGINASVADNGSMQELTSLASGNSPVAIGIQHNTGKGHWILVTGVTPDGDFIVNDPFGELVQKRGGGWKYTNSGGNQAGKGVVYSADFLRQVWVDRGAGTGRIMRVS